MNYLDGIPGLFHFLPCLAEKEGFGTLRCEFRLGGIQQVSTGHLHLIVQIPPLPGQKEDPVLTDGVFFLAEKEGFEPSIPFWGIHDFQSCALGQLRDFSIYACSLLTVSKTALIYYYIFLEKSSFFSKSNKRV